RPRLERDVAEPPGELLPALLGQVVLHALADSQVPQAGTLQREPVDVDLAPVVLQQHARAAARVELLDRPLRHERDSRTARGVLGFGVKTIGMGRTAPSLNTDADRTCYAEGPDPGVAHEALAHHSLHCVRHGRRRLLVLPDRRAPAALAGRRWPGPHAETGRRTEPGSPRVAGAGGEQPARRHPRLDAVPSVPLHE